MAGLAEHFATAGSSPIADAVDIAAEESRLGLVKHW